MSNTAFRKQGFHGVLESEFIVEQVVNNSHPHKQKHTVNSLEGCSEMFVYLLFSLMFNKVQAYVVRCLHERAFSPRRLKRKITYRDYVITLFPLRRKEN